MSLKRTLLCAVSLLALAGCAVGPDYERPALDLPMDYGAVADRSEPNIPSDWWTLYGDPKLNELVEAGLTRNTDMKFAVARIEEAEAVLREARSLFFPTIDANGGASRGRSMAPATPGVSTVRNTFTLTATTAFELDFWGRLRRANEAAQAQYLATRYGRDVVGLTLASAIAQTYFAVRSLQAQTEVAAENVRVSAESLDIATKRFEAGLISELDVNQAQSAHAGARAQLKEVQRQRDVTLHQLGELTGILDLQLEPGDVRALPSPPVPPAGLPASLLERRPDVRQAEAQLAAANAAIGVARAAQFPTFSLTGSYGRQSDTLSTLFESGNKIWSVGLNLMGPIFDAGRYAARTDQAVAQQKQAAALYEQAAEAAFRDVKDALSNVAWTADMEADLLARVEAARNSLRLARLRYESGYSSFLEVLDAQRTLNEAELELVRNRQAYLSYTTDLMEALGGGWTDTDYPPTAQSAPAKD
ncbi:MAG TPA: efflux transporter outer membrane subunit [Burkholderiales bacterium]|nr:efflux transporter outer membrane subunit [Burkholderiales bacterium]